MNDNNLITTILVVGSSLVTLVITKLFERKQNRAGTIKLRNEAGQIVLEGELKVTEFYKEQLEAILQKYSLLEKRLNDEVIAHAMCQQRIEELEAKYNNLQREFTLFKSQHAA